MEDGSIKFYESPLVPLQEHLTNWPPPSILGLRGEEHQPPIVQLTKIHDEILGTVFVTYLLQTFYPPRMRLILLHSFPIQIPSQLYKVKPFTKLCK